MTENTDDRTCRTAQDHGREGRSRGGGITKDEGHVLGLKGRNLVDNVVWQLDAQPLPLKHAEGQMKT